MPSAAGPRPAAVHPRPLADLAERCGARVDGPGPVVVTGVTLDSRDVVPGDLYAALPGARTHGASHAVEAVARGAVAVLTDPAGRAEAESAGVPVLVVPAPRNSLGDLAAEVYGRPTAGAHALDVVGVTGTNGKTTVAHLVAAGVEAAGSIPGLVGTIETRIGGERLASARTTPEAPALQALLAVMRERGVRTVAMEVSSHALALGRVDGTGFAVAGFTNLTQDHLDFHGDMERYFAAKAALFDPTRARLGLVTVDDGYGERLADLARGRGLAVRTLSVTGRSADWAATAVADEPGGVRARVRGPDGEHADLRLALPGTFNLANGLLAYAALRAVGVDPAAALRGLAAARVPGRMERLAAEPGDPAVVVDYAHSPDSVARALAALRPGTRGRLVAVVGAGGDRDTAKRPAMGEAAARGADVVVVTDDNPRSEDPAAIRRAVLEGAATVPAGDRAELHEVAGRGEAIAVAVALAGPDDVVAVLGKGHEAGQEIAGTVHPFDDREVAAAALADRSRHGQPDRGVPA